MSQFQEYSLFISVFRVVWGWAAAMEPVAAASKMDKVQQLLNKSNKVSVAASRSFLGRMKDRARSRQTALALLALLTAAATPVSVALIASDNDFTRT